MEQIEQDSVSTENSFVVKRPEAGLAKRKEQEGKNEEETFRFAEGLPDWDIVPPQVVVRRRKTR